MRDKIERLEKLGLTLHKSESGKHDFYAKKGVAFYVDTLESMTDEEFEKKLSSIKPEPPSTNDVLIEILGELEGKREDYDNLQFVEWHDIKEIFKRYIKE